MALQEPNLEQSEQREVPVLPESTPTSVPATGRPAFRQLKRELSDDDLAGPGARKLILEMLLTAETDRDEYKAYVTKYYDMATRAAVLDEKLKANETNEIMFTVGVGVGGAIIGLTPIFWNQGSNGIITLAVGILLAVGALIGRRTFRRKTAATRVVPSK